MGVFFFLDGSNHLQSLVIGQVGYLLVRHAEILEKFAKKNSGIELDHT
jgi:hypothetical protein